MPTKAEEETKKEKISVSKKKLGHTPKEKSSAPVSTPRQKPFLLDIHAVKTQLPHPIWFVPTDKPIVRITFTFLDAGMKNFNKTFPALRSLLSVMLFKGAGKFDEDAFQGKMEEAGVSASFYICQDDAECQVWVPSSSYEEAIHLAVLAMTKPRIDRKLLETARKEALQHLEESLNSPQTHLAEASQQYFYGDNHPCRVSIDACRDSLKKIKRKDLLNFLKYLSQKNLQIVVLGPRTLETPIIKALETQCSKLPSECPPLLHGEFPLLQPKEDKHVEFDVPQTLVASWLRGFSIEDPQYFEKVLALACIASSPFASVMFKELRTKRGLAYCCYGNHSTNSTHQKINYFVGTQNENAEEAKKVWREQLKKIAEKGIDKETFEVVKSEYIGQMTVGLDSTDSIVERVASLRALRFSLEETQHFDEKYRKATYENVKKASQSLAALEPLVFVTVGKKIDSVAGKKQQK